MRNERRRISGFIGVAAGAVLLASAVTWLSGRTGLPAGTSGTPSPQQPATGDCRDVPPIDARSSEYRVYFPCVGGVGMASGPRVSAAAPDVDLLSDAMRQLLDGPTAEERAAGMIDVAADADGELVVDVVLQPDGLAIVDFDGRLADAGPTAALLEVVGPTALQFAEVTAVELRLEGDCGRFFALFSTLCDHIAEPVALDGDCPVIAPAALPSGSGTTMARPFPGDARAVSWGAGDDTVTQRVGERGGEPFLTDGRSVEVRGQPGFVAVGRPWLAWVEDRCPYLVIMPAQGEFVLVDLAAAGMFGTAAAALPALPAAPFEFASVEEDGVSLSLRLDRSTTAFGERVWAEVVVQNVGADVVHWGHSSTCTWPAAVVVTTDAPMPAAGAEWPGDAGVLKRVAFDSSDGLRFIFAPEPFVDQEGNFGFCTGDLVPDEILPGQRLTNRFAWDTIGLNAMPPPGGRYVAESTFGYRGRGNVPPNADPFARSLTVSVSLDVQPPSTDYLSPGQAIDALLADPGFVEMLAEAPRERWTGASLQWVDETWTFELRLDRPSEALVATVDAITGAVSRIETVAR